MWPKVNIVLGFRVMVNDFLVYGAGDAHVPLKGNYRTSVFSCFDSLLVMIGILDSMDFNMYE